MPLVSLINQATSFITAKAASMGYRNNYWTRENENLINTGSLNQDSVNYSAKVDNKGNSEALKNTENNLRDFKKRMALEYHKSYQRTIILKFVLVLLKRYITDEGMQPRNIFYLLASLVLFYLLSKMYSLNEHTMRFIPFLYSAFSYFTHTAIIFKGAFDVYKLGSDGESGRWFVEMTKDKLFRHIISSASMSLNLMYISIFLISSRRDCILVNLVIWGIFIRDVLMQ